MTMIASDFETNYDETNNTAEVWSAASVDSSESEPDILRNVADYVKFLYWKGNATVYFHNLKFDGEFILYHLWHNKLYKHAFDEKTKRFKPDKEMKPREFKYLISKTGVWYSITIKTKIGFIRIMDSFKKSPLSLKKSGEAFGTKHQKLEMNHEKWHDEFTVLTKQEEDYIKNDVMVMIEFLEEFENQGHTKMTIGSCALAEFIKMYGKMDFKKDFPKIYERELYPGMSEGQFILNAYHGAFVYVNPYKKGLIIKNGWTLDVNSLYAYVMHSMSGNLYPYGYGMYWKKEKPKRFTKENSVSYIHFKCKFRVRDGYLPFVHIKNNPYYPASKILETSDFWLSGEWIEKIEDMDSICEFTMQDKEYDVFLKHYETWELEVIDGISYYARAGIFDDYLDHFMEIKKNSTGGKRFIAKQFLVNLYGKFATKPDSSFKVISPETEDILKYYSVEAYEKKPGYIPIGAAITSNAMLYTLEHAQKCYHKGEPGFCYSDTDSIHGDGDIPEGFKIDNKELGCWDLELEWDEALFLRVKSYIEIKDKKMSITCAGMPQHCKDLFAKSCGCETDVKPESEEEEIFLKKERSILDFKPGLVVPGKLRPTRVSGGIALLKNRFTIKYEREYGEVYGRDSIL